MSIRALFFFSFFSSHLFAQNLYSEINSIQYAKYLLQSGRYVQALDEYERIIFLSPTNSNVKLDALKAYRLSGNAAIGIEKSKLWYVTIPDSSTSFEVAKLHMSIKDWKGGEKFWSTNPYFKEEDKMIFKASELIFTDKIKMAKVTLNQSQLSSPPLDAYRTVINKSFKSKSPFVGGLLSAIVPGLGKTYASSWKDGIISLIFTASMAFQAQRNFKKFGVENYRGWIYGTLGTGFYVGSIYGSVQEVKKYNLKKSNQIKHEISDIFNSSY
ncbi:MAG: tetratricopeptide repeat protein [Leadbetterella sp.]